MGLGPKFIAKPRSSANLGPRSSRSSVLKEICSRNSAIRGRDRKRERVLIRSPRRTRGPIWVWARLRLRSQPATDQDPGSETDPNSQLRAKRPTRQEKPPKPAPRDPSPPQLDGLIVAAQRSGPRGRPGGLARRLLGEVDGGWRRNLLGHSWMGQAPRQGRGLSGETVLTDNRPPVSQPKPEATLHVVEPICPVERPSALADKGNDHDLGVTRQVHEAIRELLQPCPAKRPVHFW